MEKPGDARLLFADSSQPARHYANTIRAMSDLDSLRLEVARVTRRGIGMTIAACLYWLGLALITALAGLQPQVLAAFFLVATVLVYPLGWLLDRACGGDLFARGHPLSGLLAMLAATEALGVPMMAVLLRDEPGLLAFALAAMLGAHFVPFGWLYQSPAYYTLGIGTVVLSALLQWWLPARAPLLIPVAMTLCYALAVFAVWRELRQRG
jgi:GNAT superfamily N-acetyltransferase